jgi:glycine cleavage system aminomethyltransferase T
MENSTGQPVVTSVSETCLAAGAVLHDRDGHAVIAHYGSVPGEIAVCMKSVGLADHADYGVVELRGARELLDRALVAQCGDPPLAIGTGRRLRNVWYLRVDARRTLLAGPYAALASGLAIGQGLDRSDLAHRDIGAELAIIGIVGPRAARLLSAAGLPSELRLGTIGANTDDSGVVAILRESRRRYLAFVRAEAADAFWARLLTAGEPLGAAFVGYDALALLDASGVTAR